MNNDDHLRYPIGKFAARETYTAEELKEFIDRIEALPHKVEAAFNKLTNGKLDATYRDGGWTARQVLHHISDSHMNAYIRFKWTLTEDTPTIKAYNEKAWAETAETKLDPIISVNFLKALHVKWVALLKSLKQQDLQKEFVHPETKKQMRLDRMLALYAWHGEHHLAHLDIIAKKN